MTAALKPVVVSVDQLISIQRNQNLQPGSVALSVVTQSALSGTDCQAPTGGCAAFLERDANKMITSAVADVEDISTIRGSNDSIIVSGEEEKETEGLSPSASVCSGPSTPEHVDTVGVQELDDDKPSSLIRVQDESPSVALLQCDLERGTGGGGSENDLPSRPVEGPGSERFPMYGAALGCSVSGEVTASLPCTASTINQAVAPPFVESPANADAASDASCGGDAQPSQDVVASPPCDERAIGPLNTLAGLTVLTPPVVGNDSTSKSDLSGSYVEPVTPTTPPKHGPSAPLLPPASDPQRMTLVLDLDGTLIASEDEPHAPVAFDYCVDEERFVWLRPGLRRFLDSVRAHFEVVLFTAAGESWATSALQRIDPGGTIFDSRLYRDHTVSHDDWPWVKDLSRLGRDLARVVIVDDNPLMFMYQPDNALHVAAYDPQLTGHNDDVLEQALDVLMHKVLIADDVREVLRNMKDPIRASCMAVRHAAAKAAASARWPSSSSSGTAPRSQGRKGPIPVILPADLAPPPAAATATSGSQGRKGPVPAAAPAGLVPPPRAVAATQLAQGAPANGASDAPTDQSLLGAAAAGVLPKLSRRARRLVKHQQQQRQLQEQGPLPAGRPHGAAAAASANKAASVPAGTSNAPEPRSEKRQRRPRSRRRGAGAGAPAVEAGTDVTTGASAARAQASADNILSAAMPPPAAAQRPPVVVSRIRGPKHSLKGSAAGPSPLQQPEQQLQLKLKLLLLQREQEEEEEEAERQRDIQEEDEQGHCAWNPAARAGNHTAASISARAEDHTAASISARAGEHTAASISARAPAALLPSEPADPASISAGNEPETKWLAAEREAKSAMGYSGSPQAFGGPLAVIGALCVLADAAAAKAALQPRSGAGESKPRNRRRRRRVGDGAVQEVERAPAGRAVKAVAAAQRRSPDGSNGLAGAAGAAWAALQGTA